MPELPDVDQYRRVLTEHAQRKMVRALEVYDPQILRNAAPRELSAAEGRHVSAPTRHGKWLIVPFSPVHGPHPVLLMHFGMTGELVAVAGDEPPGRSDRADLVLTGGRIRYRDMRKLKGWWWAREANEVDELLRGLGPDAADVDAATFAARLTTHRRGLKSALLDQDVLAGLGNLLTDEILWRACLHPALLTTELSGSQLDTLHATMRRVLRDSMCTGRVPERTGWLTEQRDTPDPRCPRCGRPLRKRRVAGRGTWLCPHCQRD